MLPKFIIKKYDDYSPGSVGRLPRWFVETDWYVVDGRNLHTTLQVTTSGRLDVTSAGWATEAKAKAAIEQCKARLR